MNLKENHNKLLLVRWMMISAQLIITGFAVHWLSMQYQERRLEVVSEISSVWESTQQMMIDSMLMKQYIAPAMDSTAEFNFNFEFNSDSVRKVITTTQITHSGQIPPVVTLPARNSRIVIKLNDSTGIKAANQQPENQLISRNLVLQGVKLFINTHGDSTTSRTATVADWQMKPDTSMLMDSLASRLKMIDPGISIRWVNDSLSKPDRQARTIRYQLITADNQLEAGIEGFNSLVIKGIWPQFLFALLLVLLTAISFFISFRSLKQQLILNQQRSGFIRNMSHELKTPVATVKVALEALRKYNRRNDPVAMEEYLDIAAAEANRLELLIERVMQVSEVNERQVNLNPESIDMDELIRGVLQSFKPRFETEDTRVVYNPPSEVIRTKADRLHIQGVLINLIDNSLKYSETPAHLEVRLSADADYVRIGVADRGKGIPTAYHGRIFEKFFRVPTGDLHNVKGYGLGLSYAEMVIRQHGGKITCSHNPGGGTIIEFTLPVQKL